MGSNARKPVFGDIPTTKAQTRCLISLFVIRLLESITSRLAMSEISIFYLLAAAEETGLSLAFSETLKAGFFRFKAHILRAKRSAPFPAGDHKAQINRCVQRHSKHKIEKNT